MRNLPNIDWRYWATLSVASVFGTNTGDFLSDNLHLGHLAGLPVLALVVAAIFVVERFSPRSSPIYFWATIITIRTAATNVGDSFRDYGIGFNIAIPLCLILFSASVVWYQKTMRLHTGPTNVVRANPVYWLCMLLAGVMGTLAGDFCGFALGLGTEWAAVILSVICLAMMVGGRQGKWYLPAYYWTLIWMIRSAGTSIGDSLANDVLSLNSSTTVTGILFIALLFAFYRRTHTAEVAA